MQRLTRDKLEAVLDKLLIFLECSTLQDAVATVALVVEQGVTLPRHVNTYLVRTTRLKTTLHQRNVAIAAQHLEVCHGMLTVGAVGKDIHLQALLGATADVSDDSTLVLGNVTPHKGNIAAILKQEGYIADYAVADAEVGKTLTIDLKYGPSRQRSIQGIKRVSKPGLRVYAGADELPRVLRGLGIAIISTSKGVMTDKAARAAHVGGEVLAFVW